MACVAAGAGSDTAAPVPSSTRYTCLGGIRREDWVADFDLDAWGGYAFPSCPGSPGQLVRAPESAELSQERSDGVGDAPSAAPPRGADTDKTRCALTNARRDREPDDTPDRGCRTPPGQGSARRTEA
ncbi:hypothetical protein Ade02nite_26400 [Paractinoplanes deccanensis]|uniref:Secreted protein n=1 Tax=Paractinoplanes deccanensis TaxID=113561 RepID=A0ABQ3Y1W9_9ACTN|nr:hypothetical protein Ade02nite_26400 [Actinoplanes deccanensis]